MHKKNKIFSKSRGRNPAHLTTDLTPHATNSQTYAKRRLQTTKRRNVINNSNNNSGIATTAKYTQTTG